MTPPTVLLIEDDENIVLMVRSALGDEGYNVLSGIGWRALQMAEECQPDLVLLDMMLPLLDGPQILDYLRKCGATRHIPVVVMTAMRDVLDEVKALGAVALLAKPFQLDALVHVVESFRLKENDTHGS